MSLRDHILENFWLKTFSLFLATLIWFVIQSNIQSESRSPENPFRLPHTRDFRRPIAVHTSPSTQQAFRIKPHEVVVTVAADDKATLDKLSSQDVDVYLRLTDVPEAQGSFPIEVKLPSKVSLQQVWPMQVDVEPIKPN